MIDDELKKLILEYIKAHNAKDYTGAELILHDLNKMKELLKDDTNANEFRC
jgi:hypothetical protein